MFSPSLLSPSLRFGAVTLQFLKDENGGNVDNTGASLDSRSLRLRLQVTDDDATAWGSDRLSFYESSGSSDIVMVSDMGGLRGLKDVLQDCPNARAYFRSLFQVLKQLPGQQKFDGMVDAGTRTAAFSLLGQEIKSKLVQSLKAAAEKHGFSGDLNQALAENAPLF